MHCLAAFDIEKLPRDVDALLGVITDLHSQYATILDSLHQQLQNLRRLHFGATSEKLSGQPELFCADTAAAGSAAGRNNGYLPTPTTRSSIVAEGLAARARGLRSVGS
jgi:hypothetical protein